MRPLAPADLTVAARALLALPAAERRAAIWRLISAAEAADRYMRQFRKPHPRWGNGTLEAAARADPLPPARSLSDPDYLFCLSEVLAALAARTKEPFAVRWEKGVASAAQEDYL